MPTTYTLISSVTVGSGGAATMSFTSIPSTYTDLKVVASLRATGSRSTDALVLYYNSDTTGTNYPLLFMRGDGSSTGGGLITSGYSGMYSAEINGGTSTTSTFTNFEMYISNYRSANQKSSSIDVVQEANQSVAYNQFVAPRWTSTSAITSITLTDHNGNNFAQYSTAYLYGISNT